MAISSVRGTVSRTFFDGKGAEVTEVFTKRDGTEGKTRWSAFFEEPHGLREGDTVEVSGLHGDKIEEFESGGEIRRVVKRTLNKTRVKTDGAPAGHQSSPAVSEPEPWATTAPPVSGPAQGQPEANGFSFDETAPF